MDLKKKMAFKNERRRYFESSSKMVPKKIYISGKITGADDYMHRFEEAENALKNMFPGVSVINAAMPTDTTYEQYMAMSFTMLDMCDTIYMMSGWEQSNGAKREKVKANELGLNTLYQVILEEA